MTTEYPPPSSVPQSYGGAPAARTNVLSIISLVASLVGLFFWFLGPIAGVVCGHIALSQIKRTGEKGHGMALAGVIVGYVLIGVQILIAIGYVVLFAALVNSPTFMHSLSTSS